MIGRHEVLCHHALLHHCAALLLGLRFESGLDLGLRFGLKLELELGLGLELGYGFRFGFSFGI